MTPSPGLSDPGPGCAAPMETWKVEDLLPQTPVSRAASSEVRLLQLGPQEARGEQRPRWAQVLLPKPGPQEGKKCCHVRTLQARFRRELRVDLVPRAAGPGRSLPGLRPWAGGRTLGPSLLSPGCFSCGFRSTRCLCLCGRSPCTRDSTWWAGFRGPSHDPLTTRKTSGHYRCLEQPGTSAEMWLKPRDQGQKRQRPRALRDVTVAVWSPVLANGHQQLVAPGSSRKQKFWG